MKVSRKKYLWINKNNVTGIIIVNKLMKWNDIDVDDASVDVHDEGDHRDNDDDDIRTKKIL